MEDQPSDSSDLTSDAAVPVPQGKEARKRHRLPRHPSRETESTEPESTEPEESTGSEESVTPEAPDEQEPETPQPSARRRRWTWRPRKGAAEPADATDITEPAESSDPEAASETTESEPESTADTAEDTEAAEVTESEPEPEPAPAPEPILVPHRTAPKALKVAAVIASVLVVAAAAFAGSVLQPYLADRAVVQTKQEVAQRAADAIRVLWTYTPEDIDQLGSRTAKYLGGDLAKQYREFIDGIAEANKQAQVTNSTEVVGAAVESLTPTEASAIVYTNTVSTSPVTKGIPSLRYISYRLTLERRDRQWLITKMNDITSLDLTPRL